MNTLECFVIDDQGLWESTELLIEEISTGEFASAEHYVRFEKTGTTQILGRGAADGEAELYESSDAAWRVAVPQAESARVGLSPLRGSGTNWRQKR